MPTDMTSDLHHQTSAVCVCLTCTVFPRVAVGSSTAGEGGENGREEQEQEEHRAGGAG